jgi:hypothetical protein
LLTVLSDATEHGMGKAAGIAEAFEPIYYQLRESHTA